MNDPYALPHATHQNPPTAQASPLSHVDTITSKHAYHSPMPFHRTPPSSGESDAYSTVHSRVKALRFPFSAVPKKNAPQTKKHRAKTFAFAGFAGCRRLDEGVSRRPSFIPADLDILHEKRTPIWRRIGVAVSTESGDMAAAPLRRKGGVVGNHVEDLKKNSAIASSNSNLAGKKIPKPKDERLLRGWT